MNEEWRIQDITVFAYSLDLYSGEKMKPSPSGLFSTSLLLETEQIGSSDPITMSIISHPQG